MRSEHLTRNVLIRAIGLVLALVAGQMISAPAAMAQIQYLRICDTPNAGPGFYVMPGDQNQNTGSTHTYRCINENTGETVTIQIDGSGVETVLKRGKTDIAKDAERADEGAAAAAAMSRPYIEKGHRFAVGGDVGFAGDEGALSLGAAIRVDENISVSGSAAVTQGGSVATRSGFNVSW